jgi:pimeloyl-ACP methyl ester carboxylesterase
MTQLTALDLDVTYTGSGPTVVFVHGSVVGGKTTWRRQQALAAHWTLCVPNRPGFGRSPAVARGDFEAEAPLIAELLANGAHLVGHSYGAVIALCAAALRPHAVRSLTVSEPGCLRVAAGAAHVDEQIANGELLYQHADTLTPAQFLEAFRGGVGSLRPTPPQLTGRLLQGARMLMRERPPWEADLPLAKLASTTFPKLVISGGHSPVFETVCDTIALDLHAQRATVAGFGHTIPGAGSPYNELLHTFLSNCEQSAAPDQT